MKDLVELMKTYQAMLLPHFKHEEEFSLPLLRAYFTPEGEYTISCPTILWYGGIKFHLIFSSPAASFTKEFDPIMEEIMKNSDDVSSD